MLDVMPSFGVYVIMWKDRFCIRRGLHLPCLTRSQTVGEGGSVFGL